MASSTIIIPNKELTPVAPPDFVLTEFTHDKFFRLKISSSTIDAYGQGAGVFLGSIINGSFDQRYRQVVYGLVS